MARPANRPRRDDHGRFAAAPDHRLRNRGIAAGVLIAGAGLAAAVWRGWVKMPRAPWMQREGDAGRAPDHFRPDPMAVPTGDEREALRPPPGVARGFSEDKRSEELAPSGR